MLLFNCVAISYVLTVLSTELPVCVMLHPEPPQYVLDMNISLSTGTMNKDPGTMSHLLMEAIAEFAMEPQQQNTCIRLVEVVIFKQELLAPYKEEMSKVTNTGLLCST